jgi:hypothetical protein
MSHPVPEVAVSKADPHRLADMGHVLLGPKVAHSKRWPLYTYRRSCRGSRSRNALRRGEPVNFAMGCTAQRRAVHTTGMKRIACRCGSTMGLHCHHSGWRGLCATAGASGKEQRRTLKGWREGLPDAWPPPQTPEPHTGNPGSLYLPVEGPSHGSRGQGREDQGREEARHPFGHLCCQAGRERPQRRAAVVRVVL